MNRLLYSLIIFQASFFTAHILQEENVSLLLGRVEREIVYGPPGFGESPNEDEKLTQHFLYIEDEPLGKHHKIQLINMSTQQLKSFETKKVSIKGKLFSSHTGYHNTPLLMEVTDIKSLE